MWITIKRLLQLAFHRNATRESNPTQYVRFRVDNASRFASLQGVFAELRKTKNLDYAEDSSETNASNADYDQKAICDLMPADVQSNFIWPSPAELNEHRLDLSRPIRIAAPTALLGTTWSLVRILDLIDTCEYTLVRCELIDDCIGELHVRAHAYPYGGLNAIIALVDGFGFEILGVNECGKYESREQLEQNRRQ